MSSILLDLEWKATTQLMSKTLFNKELLQRYDTTGPRYTSYPTAVQFNQKYNAEDYKRWVDDSNNDPIPTPLSLYFHIPFCDSICYYCGCSKVITRDQDKAESYVDLLIKEIKLQATLFAEDRFVTQMHWGGGTPTFLEDKSIERILKQAKKSFNFTDENGEYNIEVDPRTVDPTRVGRLHNMGFNRISFGVQDFNHEVQLAVHREQNTQQIIENIQAAREHGFKSINLDLMYGLPHQNVQSFAETLETTITANPDRIAVYNYAHLPEMFKPQRRIDEEDLPPPEQKLDILNLTINTLQDNGYVHIGMDHFAKESDDLVIAQNTGTLHRNFQGYSTHADCDTIAMGITAISSIGDNYSQNVRTIEDYENKLNQNEIPVYRGLELEADDVLRREIINQLLCHFDLDIKKLEEKWKFKFFDYFKTIIPNLQDMEDDGLLTINDDRLEITSAGRLLARNICMQFDRYLQERKNEERFSRTI